MAVETQVSEGGIEARFDSDRELEAFLERASAQDPILRLAVRVEEGARLRVRLVSAARTLAASARVKQVFRSGTELFGTILDVEEWQPVDVAEDAVTRPHHRDEPLAPVPDPETAIDVGLRGNEGDAAADEAEVRRILGELEGLRELEELGEQVELEEPAELDDEKPAEQVESEGGDGPDGAESGEYSGVATAFEIRRLDPNRRMRLALRASRGQRQILLRDTSPQVVMALLSNPWLELKEVHEIARNPQSVAPVLQRVADDRRFSGNPEIQLALVRNPRTPTPLAIRLLDLLRTADLRVLVKSQALREGVRKAALRVYLKRSP